MRHILILWKSVILTVQVEWRSVECLCSCTTQLVFSLKKLTQPLKFHFINILIFLSNASGNPWTLQKLQNVPLFYTIKLIFRTCQVLPPIFHRDRCNAQCVYTQSHAYMTKIPTTYHKAPTAKFRLFWDAETWTFSKKNDIRCFEYPLAFTCFSPFFKVSIVKI